MAKVGIPYLKLDTQNHYVEKEKKDKHSGNARAVILEGLEERQSSDPDLKQERTVLNKYYGIRSGEELVTMLETSAAEYVITDSRGRKRHLRNNANIAFACICKPESEYINSLTKEQQEQFFDDSYEVMSQMLEARGLVVDAAVVHYDEGSPHMHIYGHDPAYNMGRKFDLNMREQMNRGYYPVEMRKRGWDVEDLPRNYDPEKAKILSKEELKEYKKECRANRKQHGKSAKTYKADKDAARIKADAEKQARQITAQAEQQARQITAQAKQQAERIKADAKSQAVQIVSNAKFDAYQIDLDNKQKTAELADRERVLAEKEHANAEKERANAEKEKMLAEKEKELQKESFRQEMEQETLDTDRSALEADRANFKSYMDNYKAKAENELKTARTELEGQLESKYINIANVVQVLKAYADEHEAMKIAAEQSAKQKGRLPSEIRKEVRSSAAMIRDIFGRRNDIMEYRNQRAHELGE